MSEETLSDSLQPNNVELKTHEYLHAHKIPFDSLENLSGGTTNYIFRLKAPDGSSKILKHAEPFIASSMGTIPFPVTRMDFEHRAMTEVPKLITPEMNAVCVPDIDMYDQKSRYLLMSDAGGSTLKAAYQNPDLDIPELGRQLGRWLAMLHHLTKKTDIGEGGNGVGRAMCRWSYSHAAEAAEKYGLDPGICRDVDEKYGGMLQTDDNCICHGDFWPGNVILNDKGVLSIFDWEMCRRGNGATDVGQFAAEAYLLDAFCGKRRLRKAFLQGYCSKMLELGLDSAQDRAFVERVVIHTGVHLSYWPAVMQWTDKEQTRTMMEGWHQTMREAASGNLPPFLD